MSFITKRERVFNDYDNYDLPARNEGKLKAYASCTDARAWSHFCSDKTEHLVEIIKKNNDKCAPKYIPTNVIVDTLMVSKNAEIKKLRQKIEELEQMLAVYDDLELDCVQKCEIAKAHEEIRAANKELDDMCLDLDLSGFTEGADSEAFQTGQSRSIESAKSRGGDLSTYGQDSIRKTESKAIQNSPSEPCVHCDACTSATDPRLEEMQDEIIKKDARLNAMQNTMAVMESDVCEPYCVYAQIYTALEKIFGILYQNDKYKQYLDLLSAGKDTRCIDIKGKILFKMKVLEKFCLALIAPCSQDFRPAATNDCSCYRSQIENRVETTFALTSSESQQPTCLDSKRAQLVAEIMESSEFNEIARKDSLDKTDENPTDDENFDIDNFDVDAENLQRLKDLQTSYEELMTCYENLKHEKDCLQMRCSKYNELETELENLRSQLRSYNQLWNEKEYFRKRSEDVDDLKEKYLVLCDEATNLESQLKAEGEINSLRTQTIEDLRRGSVQLEQKMYDAAIAFEKEKNYLQCKLKEIECKCMCQEQQIMSLSEQLDRHLEQKPGEEDTSNSILLLNEIESLKDQNSNLKDLLFTSEEEKRNLQEKFQDKLSLINDLKMEIEDWKSTYEKTINRNNYLEKYADNFRDELHELEEENKNLLQHMDEKNAAVNNLMGVISSKSEELSKLQDEIESKNQENRDLINRLKDLEALYNNHVEALENQKQKALNLYEFEKRESQELLVKFQEQKQIAESLHGQTKGMDEMERLISKLNDDNKCLKDNLASIENNNATLLQELQRLRDINDIAATSVHDLQEENAGISKSLELTQKESKILNQRVIQLDDLTKELNRLKQANDLLLREKNDLQNKLHDKSIELDNAKNSDELNNLKQANDLLLRERNDLQNKLQDKTIELDNAKSCDEFNHLKQTNDMLLREKIDLQNKLRDKIVDIDNAMHSIQLSRRESEELMNKVQRGEDLERESRELSEAYKKLVNEKYILKKQIADKNNDIENLVQSLNDVKNEKDHLSDVSDQIPFLEKELGELKEKFNKIVSENQMLQSDYENTIQKMSDLYKALENKIEENKKLSDQIKTLELYKAFSEVNLATAKSSLEDLKKENDDQKHEINQLSNMKNELKRAKDENEKLKKEKAAIENEFKQRDTNLRQLVNDNQELNKQIEHLMTLNEEIEEALMQARNKAITSQETPNVKISDLKKELDEMKNEKLRGHKKIRDLLDRIEQNESIISDLSQDVLARDDRISVMQNYINELEDEIRRLQQNLEIGITTGEEALEQEKVVGRSLKKLEAHHSKATHNMKMELAKLHKEKGALEGQVSFTKLKHQESQQEKNKYEAQIVQYQHEKDAILAEIKQLELKSVGDTSLSPGKNTFEDIIHSIDRVRRSLEKRESQNSTLEQTLLKVQTSSQLLLSKADEAKRIAEKEKSKILNEKEEAIKERLKLEKELADVKEKLDKQLSRDNSIIKDLEAEILNQKLIIDKINTSTHAYIAKLEDEMKALEKMYKESQDKINELQNTNKNYLDDNNKFNELLKKTNANLESKCQEIKSLQIALAEEKSKVHKKVSKESKYIQTPVSVSVTDNSTQTDKLRKEQEDVHKYDKNSSDEKRDDLNATKSEPNRRFNQQRTNNINEVQILAANVEPTLDFVKNSYQNYKIQKLSPGPLEQHSISSLDKGNRADSTVNNDELIDIYKRQTEKPDHSRLSTENRHGPVAIDQISRRKVPKSYTELNSANATSDSDSSKKKSKTSNETDKDLFVFYPDDKSSKTDKAIERNKSMKLDEINDSFYGKTEQLKTSKTKSNDNAKDNTPRTKKSKDNSKTHAQKVFFESSSRTDDEFANARDQHATLSDLNLGLSTRTRENTNSLPSISNSKGYDSQYSMDAASDEETIKRMLTKRKLPIQSSDTDDDKLKQKESEERAKLQDEESMLRDQSDSQDKPYSLKVDSHKSKNKHEESQRNKPHNFGLDFILETAKREDPDSMKTYDLKSLRRTHSDDSSILERDNQTNDASNFRFMSSSNEYPIHSNSSQNKMNPVTSIKYVDKSVSVNLNSDEYYEERIKSLTAALENIDKDYKKKLEAIKMQYDAHIKSIMKDHNQGVQNMQSLHEETLHDIIKVHENEIDNLRSMSIEAMKKADKYEKAYKHLKRRESHRTEEPEEVLTSVDLDDLKKNRGSDTKNLTKTSIEAFNVKPKTRTIGPCTCSIDVNISDTIRNIFEQVDVEQRRMAEFAYLKYIANKILSGNIEVLDAQELSFLHYNVCRLWKSKLSKEEALQKKIDTLEHELLHKQRNAQEHIADLDRKVAEERRRLQEVREAVCNTTPLHSRGVSPIVQRLTACPTVAPAAGTVADKDVGCDCNIDCHFTLHDRRSAGDLVVVPVVQVPVTTCTKRVKITDMHRAVLAKLDVEERRLEKRVIGDELPTRLRRVHDKHPCRPHRK